MARFLFYGGTFSNFTKSSFTYAGQTYKTVEHFFQTRKTLDNVEREKIRTAKTPGEAKRLGRRCTLRPDWESIKFNMMLEGLRAKFTQHGGMAEELKATGTQELCEDSPTDFIWGWRNNGKNLLGKALMQVRKELCLGR